jgi:hypothetical protein
MFDENFITSFQKNRFSEDRKNNFIFGIPFRTLSFLECKERPLVKLLDDRYLGLPSYYSFDHCRISVSKAIDLLKSAMYPVRTYVVGILGSIYIGKGFIGRTSYTPSCSTTVLKILFLATVEESEEGVIRRVYIDPELKDHGIFLKVINIIPKDVYITYTADIANKVGRRIILPHSDSISEKKRLIQEMWVGIIQDMITSSDWSISDFHCPKISTLAPPPDLAEVVVRSDEEEYNEEGD